MKIAERAAAGFYIPVLPKGWIVHSLAQDREVRKGAPDWFCSLYSPGHNVFVESQEHHRTPAQAINSSLSLIAEEYPDL